MRAHVVMLHSTPPDMTVSLCSYSGRAGAVLADKTMQQMLLYPPNSCWAFMPAIYQAPTIGSSSPNLTLANSTISTLCRTVNAYLSFLNKTSPESLVDRALMVGRHGS